MEIFETRPTLHISKSLKHGSPMGHRAYIIFIGMYKLSWITVKRYLDLIRMN